MNGDELATDEEARRLRNLQAVAAHLTHGRAAAEPVDPAADPEVQRERKARFIQSWGWVGLVAFLVLSKLKWAFALLKVLKMGSLVSMLLAVWVYAWFWGWPFALGFVLLILVHELGHAMVMRQQGIPAGAPVFIPFVGAVIAMKGMPKNAWVEALVGIGGPFLGSVGALVCLIVAAITGSTFWYALASTGFLINLFNMIPVSPLDGGRIVGVISRLFWAVGYAVGIGVFLLTRSPILFLVLLVGLFTLWQMIRTPPEGYYDVPVRQRLLMGGAYFGLLALMAAGMWVADQPLADFGTLEQQAAVAAP